jgi:hypothetical protein
MAQTGLIESDLSHISLHRQLPYVHVHVYLYVHGTLEYL